MAWLDFHSIFQRLFTLWHSAFAWYSDGARNLSFYLAVLVLGLVMALVYKNTKSVRLTVISHMMINILNLSIPTLLNIIKFTFHGVHYGGRLRLTGPLSPSS